MQGLSLLGQRRVDGELELLVKLEHWSDPRWIDRFVLENSFGAEAADDVRMMIQRHLSQPSNRTIVNLDVQDDIEPPNQRQQKRRKGMIKKKGKTEASAKDAAPGAVEALPPVPPRPTMIKKKKSKTSSILTEENKNVEPDNSERMKDIMQAKAGAMAILRHMKPRKMN